MVFSLLLFLDCTERREEKSPGEEQEEGAFFYTSVFNFIFLYTLLLFFRYRRILLCKVISSLFGFSDFYSRPSAYL